ncbi:DUF3872 domain-containing protein [Bacteroides muris (ex Afrizal et al. 2022)]|uniref:DUF3872 domain-containing protein n=2 Tax=Bacteroidales TaxID=171549 RepID=A0A4S2AK86_9BACE|nr:DUF3872 domain-containing protein [Bacteroides muris (ex Afrizal et al. 2022)]TGY01436.1 DUF3872 domain-containing protein [Bacteroides muris (ex Afrizal et al. 2022)]
MKKTNKNSFGVIAILSLVIAAVCSLTSCSDDLDVQQSYPFTVEVMPYADKIAKGQTIELRFEIKPEGNYANTLYTIRYFQYDGEGSLKLVDGPVLVNNDRVLLESKTFRLNYTAQSDEAHKFLVVVEDNFGSNPWEQTFEFNSKDSGDDDSVKIVSPIVTPVNPAI